MPRKINLFNQYEEPSKQFSDPTQPKNSKIEPRKSKRAQILVKMKTNKSETHYQGDREELNNKVLNAPTQAFMLFVSFS